jgi:hypothetical protein
MAFSDLTLTRDDIDAFEGETFRDLNVTDESSTLGLSSRDTFVLDKAKSELQTDILEKLHTYIADETYATETALLDAIDGVDDESLLKNVLCYKFFELWFQQDATNREGMAYEKAKMYYRKYVHYLQTNLQRLAGSLATPKRVPRFRMRSSYGY